MTRPLTHETCEEAISFVLARHLACKLRERDDPHVHAVQPLGAAEWREQARVLLVAGDDLVTGLQVEPREHGVDAIGRRAGQGEAVGVAAEHAGVSGAQAGREVADGLHVRLAAAPAVELERDPLADGIGRAAGERALGPGVQIRGPLQDRELGSEFGGVAHRGAYLMHRRAQPLEPNAPIGSKAFQASDARVTRLASPPSDRRSSAHERSRRHFRRAD